MKVKMNEEESRDSVSHPHTLAEVSRSYKLAKYQLAAAHKAAGQVGLEVKSLVLCQGHTNTPLTSYI